MKRWAFLSLGLVVVVAACGSGSDSVIVVSVSPHAQAWYALDGDAVDAISGNDGDLVGGDTVADRFGLAGGAIRLDGDDDYMEIPHHEALNVSGDFSIAVWIVFESQSSQEEWYTIFEKSDPERGGHARYGLWIRNDTLSLCFERSDHASQPCGTASEPVPIGGWHHVAAIRDGNTVQFYIDGADAGHSLVGASPVAESSFSAFVGTDLYGDESFLRASLDDLRVYDQALTEEEVRALAEG